MYGIKNAKRKTTLIVCACVGLIAVCLLAAVIHRDSVKRFFENSVSNSTIESSQTVDKDKMREEETMSLSDAKYNTNKRMDISKLRTVTSFSIFFDK